MYIFAAVHERCEGVSVRTDGLRQSQTWKVKRVGARCACVYVCDCHVHGSAYPVPRRNTLATLPRGQTAAVETVCPANWFSLVSSIPRNRRRAARCTVQYIWRQARSSARSRPRRRIQSNTAVWLSDPGCARPIVNQKVRVAELYGASSIGFIDRTYRVVSAFSFSSDENWKCTRYRSLRKGTEEEKSLDVCTLSFLTVFGKFRENLNEN